jgi:hypothetical protein
MHSEVGARREHSNLFLPETSRIFQVSTQPKFS